MFNRFRVIITAVLLLSSTSAIATDLERCQALFLKGEVVPAYQACLPLAQVGDVQAAFNVARLQAIGIEGTPDWGKVVKWLTVSAAGNHHEAAYNLAIAYQLGKGVTADQQQALKYYQQSVELGNPKAMRNLALLYEKGEGVEKDLDQAFSLYQRSAEQGLADSQLKTGLMLLQGEGVEKDPQVARYWIELAAESGDDKAQLALGVLLIDFDPYRAIHWYNQAVSRGNPYAAHNLALVYFEGTGVPVDMMQALAYAETSNELGNGVSEALYQKILAQLQQPIVSDPQSISKPMATVESDRPRLEERNLEWLKAQPARHYVVQLARLNSHNSAESFIQEQGLLNTAHAVVLDTHDYVVLLKQDFSDIATAQNALKVMLPQSLTKDAWIRSYRSLYTH
ncbi:MAG: SEL1-like repeat protein [Amphritea sp.]|nr:SEL1-like repeat protein [Amphritea sp.]